MEKAKAQIEERSYSVSWKLSFEESKPVFLCCLHKEFTWIGLFQQTKCFVANDREERGQDALEKKAKSEKWEIAPAVVENASEMLHRTHFFPSKPVKICSLWDRASSSVVIVLSLLSGVRIIPLINTAWANASAAASNDETLLTSLPPLFGNCGSLFFS